VEEAEEEIPAWEISMLIRQHIRANGGQEGSPEGFEPVGDPFDEVPDELKAL
jgi:hypothetical protein